MRMPSPAGSLAVHRIRAIDQGAAVPRQYLARKRKPPDLIGGVSKR